MLKEVNFNDYLNFKLMSLGHLLKQGWKIVKDDLTGIVVSNDAQETIDFDIHM